MKEILVTSLVSITVQHLPHNNRKQQNKQERYELTLVLIMILYTGRLENKLVK